MNTIQINKPGNTTLVMIMCPTGSNYENPKYKGISHFLEHICFKGTKNRTCKEISASIENIGGILNAFTDYEVTAYWAKVGNTHKDLAIDVIEDLVLNSTIPWKEVEKERDVIIQELKMYEDAPKYYACELFYKSLFNRNSGMYLPIIGTTSTLKNIHSKEIKDYYNENYHALTKIIIGNVPDLVTSTEYSLPLTEQNINKKPKDNLLVRKDIKQANIIMGNAFSINYNKEKSILLSDLLCSLYNDMSGRLFTVIREQNNLVYRIKFDVTYHRNGTLIWEVELGLDKNNIEKARKLIIKELVRPITDKEIDVIVEKAIGEMEMDLDENISIAEIVSMCVSKNLNYNKLIREYKESYRELGGFINAQIEMMNFKNNVLVGIVPEGD